MIQLLLKSHPIGLTKLNDKKKTQQKVDSKILFLIPQGFFSVTLESKQVGLSRTCFHALKL